METPRASVNAPKMPTRRPSGSGGADKPVLETAPKKAGCPSNQRDAQRKLLRLVDQAIDIIESSESDTATSIAKEDDIEFDDVMKSWKPTRKLGDTKRIYIKKVPKSGQGSSEQSSSLKSLIRKSSKERQMGSSKIARSKSSCTRSTASSSRSCRSTRTRHTETSEASSRKRCPVTRVRVSNLSSPRHNERSISASRPKEVTGTPSSLNQKSPMASGISSCTSNGVRENKPSPSEQRKSTRRSKSPTKKSRSPEIGLSPSLDSPSSSSRHRSRSNVVRSSNVDQTNTSGRVSRSTRARSPARSKPRSSRRVRSKSPRRSKSPASRKRGTVVLVPRTPKSVGVRVKKRVPRPSQRPNPNQTLDASTIEQRSPTRTDELKVTSTHSEVSPIKSKRRSPRSTKSSAGPSRKETTKVNPSPSKMVARVVRDPVPVHPQRRLTAPKNTDPEAQSPNRPSEPIFHRTDQQVVGISRDKFAELRSKFQ